MSNWTHVAAIDCFSEEKDNENSSAIDRCAVLSYIDHVSGSGMGKTKSLEYIRAFVEKQPPSTPQQDGASNPETSYWEKAYDGHCYWYRCAACGSRIPKTEWKDDYFSPYCPECGRKMVEAPTN